MEQNALNESQLDTLCSLKVIAKLRDNERLSTKSEVVTIQNGKLITALKRWLNAENRADNIKKLYEIFNRAFETRKASAKNGGLCRMIEMEIRNALRGVEALKVTYKMDSMTCAKLDVLTENVEHRLGTNFSKLL